MQPAPLSPAAAAPSRIDEFLELDARRRELLPEVEEIRATKNAASKRIGELQRAGRGRLGGDRGGEAARRSREGPRRRAARRGGAPGRRARLAAEPAGPERARTRTRCCARWARAGASGPDHLELLGDLIDLEAGARVAGSRFAYLKGSLVLLELALVRWTMEVLEEKGFEPVVPPVLVREEALFGTGFLPDTEQQIYSVAEDDLYLAGTSEVPLASLHGDQILDAGRAAAPLRRLLHLLPARGGRGGQGHARHLPRAPVRQGRDVLVRRAVDLAATSTSASSRSRRSCSRPSRSPTAS